MSKNSKIFEKNRKNSKTFQKYSILKKLLFFNPEIV